MIVGNTMDVYKATLSNGEERCLSAFSAAQALALFQDSLPPFLSIVLLTRLDNGFAFF
jgi:hypothetical protein